MFFKKKFFDEQEEKLIVNAIRAAENKTSGEIRVHVTPNIKISILDDAAIWFNKLKMHETKNRNGVLIYLAYDDKEFAIIGDSGINKKVPENFWEDIKNQMNLDFKEGLFCNGIVNAINKSGEQLKAFFPVSNNDKNELNDNVSYGE